MTDFLRGDEIAACVHRVALSRGEPFNFARPRTAPEHERRRRDAEKLRRAVISDILELHPDSVVADSSVSTVDAIRAGAPLIVNPRLPGDGEALRRAHVHALVRVGRVGVSYAYSPVLIKNNELVEAASTRRTLVGSLARIGPSEANFRDGVGVRSNPSTLRNGLALSHAIRVLQTMGVADPDAHGAIVDRHREVWWFDLGSSSYPRFNLSAYQRYYDERLAVVRAHERWRNGEGPFPTEPYWHRDCLECPYNEPCGRELRDRDDVSLTRFTTFDQQLTLREHGVNTRHDLARLDPGLARQRAGPATVTDRPETHVARVVSHLDELIYRARAHERGPLRIVDADRVGCPTADVEVDIDTESYGDSTYLWGALVTVNRPLEGVRDGYVAFANWDDHTAGAPARIFAAFWRWFDDLRQQCRAQDRSVSAYCFWAQAEDGAMNRAVEDPLRDGPTRVDLDEFRLGSPTNWIDLHHLAKTQIQTDGPIGLKVMAGLAGFTWRDANPSGEASMLWYEVAVSSSDEAAGSRARILEYNEDDCRATRALRQWLNGPARLLAHRDDFEGVLGHR